MNNWPTDENGKNKRVGDMTREEQRAVFAASCKRLQAEFEHPAMQAKLSAVLRGENVNQ